MSEWIEGPFKECPVAKEYTGDIWIRVNEGSMVRERLGNQATTPHYEWRWSMVLAYKLPPYTIQPVPPCFIDALLELKA